jgi:hypothetical protein
LTVYNFVDNLFSTVLHNSNKALYISVIKTDPFMFNNEIRYTKEDLHRLADVDLLPSRMGIFFPCDIYDPLPERIKDAVIGKPCKN